MDIFDVFESIMIGLGFAYIVGRIIDRVQSFLKLEKGIDEPTESGWFLCRVDAIFWDVVYFDNAKGWEYDREITTFFYLPTDYEKH